MLYRITSITDREGNPKTEQEVIERMSYTYRKPMTHLGALIMLRADGSGQGFVTSQVVSKNGDVWETMNSIYTIKEVEK